MNPPPSPPPHDDQEFFVGYLPAPPRISRGLARVALALLSATILVPIGIALAQRDPGGGQWDLDHQTQVKGRMVDAAVPILKTGDGREVLLVGEGKHAAPALPSLSLVTVTGSSIRRDGWEMLEVSTATTSDKTAGPRVDRHTDRALPSQVQHFRGEILDSKCYLGAMKPGDGKPHKACAALCLRGGVPPLLRTTEDKAGNSLYLMTAANGGAIPPAELIPFVGDPIELDATPVPGASRPTLQLVAGGIRRLRP